MAGNLMEITDGNFEQEVLNSDKPALVDFWAPWCGPCRMVGPIVEELANDFGDRAVVGKLNVDNNANVAGKYGITSIPTLMIFKGGEVVDKIVGMVPKATLQETLEKHL